MFVPCTQKTSLVEVLNLLASACGEPMKLAIREQIALPLYLNKQTAGNAGPTTGRITSTELLYRTGYQIRKDGTCDIGLKYDGRRGRLRWQAGDQERNRDKGGDRDRDRRSGM